MKNLSLSQNQDTFPFQLSSEKLKMPEESASTSMQKICCQHLNNKSKVKDQYSIALDNNSIQF